MERTSLGYLRMSADEFEQSTPREIQWRLMAETGREDREFQRVAQLACWVINPWLKSGSQITPRKLLRRKPARLEG